MPCGRIKRPLATAFFLTSAAARVALSSTPLPQGGLSPIITALRDLLIEVPKVLDPPAVAAVECLYSVRMSLSCNIKYQMRNPKYPPKKKQYIF